MFFFLFLLLPLLLLLWLPKMGRAEKRTHRAIIKYLNVKFHLRIYFYSKGAQRSLLTLVHNALTPHMSCIARHNTSPDSKIKKTIAPKMRAYSDSDILYQHISALFYL